MRCGPTPKRFEVPELGLDELPLGDGVERELHGLVAVGVARLHLRRPGTGPASITVTEVTDAGVRVEDLGHAELPAEDSLRHR